MQKCQRNQAKIEARKRAMDEAVGAYIRCEALSDEERKRLISQAHVKTGVLSAIKLTFAFAHGYIANPWSVRNLRSLTRAWLRLGEALFKFIYRLVRPRGEDPNLGLPEVLELVPRTAVV